MTTLMVSWNGSYFLQPTVLVTVTLMLPIGRSRGKNSGTVVVAVSRKPKRSHRFCLGHLSQRPARQNVEPQRLVPQEERK